MDNAEHFSTVRFTDDDTLASLKKDAPDTRNLAEPVVRLFDRTKITIGPTAERRSSPRKSIDDLDSQEWERLRDALTQRIVDVIVLLARTIDLRSNEWKNAPAVWEMLSFDHDVLHSAQTPLPDALREAKVRTEALLPEEMDVDALMNDVDEVIHQTHGRREAIERVMDAAMDAEISETALLHTAQIPGDLLGRVQQDVRRELRTTDEILAASTAKAICNACCKPADSSAQPPNFHLEAGEVTRVTGEEAMSSAVGDVYLVRSKNVSAMGDHYIVIIGGLVQKPHGLRPADMPFSIPDGQSTPLDSYSPEETLVLLKLDDAASRRFYETYNVPTQYRRS